MRPDDEVRRLELENARLRAQLAGAQRMVRQLLLVIRLGRASARIRYLPDPAPVIPAQRAPLEEARARRR